MNTFTLRLPSGAEVELAIGRRLTAEDLLELHSATGDGIIAEVNPNPSAANILGLKNLSTNTWRTSGGTNRKIENGQTVRLGAASVIEIGPAAAKIEHRSSGYVLAPGQAPGIPLRPHDRITAPILLGLQVAPRAVIAEVEQNPRDPTVLGLKNLSGREWGAVMPDGTQRRIPSGRAPRLAAGVRIDLGGIEARVEEGAVRQRSTARLATATKIGIASKLPRWLSSNQSRVAG